MLSFPEIFLLDRQDDPHYDIIGVDGSTVEGFLTPLYVLVNYYFKLSHSSIISFADHSLTQNIELDRIE